MKDSEPNYCRVKYCVAKDMMRGFIVDNLNWTSLWSVMFLALEKKFDQKLSKYLG